MRLGRGHMAFVFLGLAFARAWVALLFADPLSPGYGSGWGTSFFDIAYVGCALAAIVGFRRVIPLTARRWPWMLSAALMTVASVGFVADGWLGLGEGAAAVVSLTGGSGFLLYTLVNAEVLATQALRSVILYLSAGRILSWVLTFFFSDMGFDRVAVAAVALPFVALAMTRAALDRVPERNRPLDTCPRFSMPWILLALMGVYSFVYGLHQGTLAPGVGRYASLFNAALALLIVLLVLLAPGKLSFRVLCNVPAVFLACGFLLMSLEGALVGVVADMLIALAFDVAKITVVFLFYDMSRRLGISIVVLSASLAAVEVFGLAGNGVAFLLAQAEAGAAAGTLAHAVIIALAFAVGVMALTRRDAFSDWGARLTDPDEGGEDAGVPNEAIAERCERMADQWGLTAREREVLGLVARGLTSRQVQDALFIAEGTFKTHMRHIYEKSGVRGQKQLRLLLQRETGLAADEDRAPAPSSPARH